MNLLFVLLRNAEDSHRERLKALAPRGTKGRVWQLIKEQAHGDFDKNAILSETNITSSHLDKITSELLASCYSILFGDDVLGLLEFLSHRVQFIRLFYHELARRSRTLSKLGDRDTQAEFIKHSFRMVHTNMPIAYRDARASIKLARLYISLFKSDKKKEAEFHMGCTLLFERIESLFAASDFKDKAHLIDAEFTALGEPLPGFDEQVVFDYYWTRMYFYNAMEDFPAALEITQSALKVLAGYTGHNHKLNILRMQLKVNEFLYYLSRFDEARRSYKQILASPSSAILPDRQYHITKYVQLCLITGHYEEAGLMMANKIASLGDRVEELIIVRDIVTYVKYCLFIDDLDTAFRFIQLGFEKNPKGKYFQYEIELRNLQTAYFFLSGKEDVAVEMCLKHIKFLRNHGYTTATSDYPFFYVLIKAIFEKNARGILPRYQKALDRYQESSFAYYGRLLLKIAKHISAA